VDLASFSKTTIIFYIISLGWLLYFSCSGDKNIASVILIQKQREKNCLRNEQRTANTKPI
jgi:hypothetical protein